MRMMFLISTAIMSCVLHSSPVKSALGANGINYEDIESEDYISASEYIQNGLVAIYDGIENVGYKSHSNHSLTWINLTGNGYNLPLSGQQWRKNCLDFLDIQRISTDGIIAVKTIEAVVELYDYDTYIIGNSSMETGRRLWITPGYIGYSYYYDDRQSAKLEWNINEKMHLAYTLVNFVNANYYCNGILLPTTTGVLNSTYTANIGIGPFKGRIYCVRMYTRRLSGEEIAYNYEIDKERFNLK